MHLNADFTGPVDFASHHRVFYCCCYGMGVVDRDEDQKGIRSEYQVRKLGGWLHVVVAWWRLEQGFWRIYEWCSARLLNKLGMCTNVYAYMTVLRAVGIS